MSTNSSVTRLWYSDWILRSNTAMYVKQISTVRRHIAVFFILCAVTMCLVGNWAPARFGCPGHMFILSAV